MPRRREINAFSLSFLDIISGALGAVIILYVAVPKGNPQNDTTKKIEELVRAKDAQMQEMQNELAELRELRESAKLAIQENEALKTQVAATPPVESKEPTEDMTGMDVGFKFKGRNIVFIVDTSRSMLDEDRMGQVKAGLKMLLTSMPPQYRIEIVQFPNGSRSPYRALFKEMKELGTETKLDAFDFIYAMKPDGATPTRDTLNYIFKNYMQMTDIVLLTDGEPSLHQSPIKDDIYDLLGHIRELNKILKVQINTIGVGQEVLHDKTGKPYQFLRMLAEQNSGFFVGF
ncbi:MAG: VWA domain-containing protein [Bacteriovoracia bacterium]